MGGLTGPQVLDGGLLGKRDDFSGEVAMFRQKIKEYLMESGIFNDKKSL